MRLPKGRNGPECGLRGVMGVRLILPPASFLIIKNPFLIIKNPFLIIKNPFLIIKNPFLIIKNPFLIIKNGAPDPKLLHRGSPTRRTLI
jgi:hypothetical protein